MPALRMVEPVHFAVRQDQRSQSRVCRIQHRDPGLCDSDQRQLVADVARLAAMPVQVLGKQIQYHRDLRPHFAGSHIQGLVAGQLDGPERRRWLRCQHFQQRQADIAGQRRALPTGTQQVGQQRRRGALALGAGDADRVRSNAIRARMLTEPQRASTNETRAVFRSDACRFLVGTDARGLDDNVLGRQRFASHRGFNHQQRIRQAQSLGRFFLATEQSQRQSRQARTQRPIGGMAFTTPAPQRYAVTFKLRNSHAVAPTTPQARDAHRQASAKAVSATPKPPIVAVSRE